MRKRLLLTSALALAACASASFAGFTVTSTLGATVGGFDRWDIVAINTGGDTGTQIKGLEYFYTGAPAAFQVDDTDEDGEPDTVNLLSTSRTRFRVSSTAFDNVFVGVIPTHGAAQPNPYAAGVSAFSGAIANLGTTQATGTGFQIARIFLPVGTSGVLSGNLGGDIGSKASFSVQVNNIAQDPFYFIESVTPDPVPVVFGSIVTNGAPFNAIVKVGGVPPGWSAELTGGAAIPAGVQLTSIVRVVGTVDQFVVSGRVDYSLNGSDVAVPVTPLGGFVNRTGSITLRVTPEPATLGVWFCPGAVAVRRRSRRG